MQSEKDQPQTTHFSFFFLQHLISALAFLSKQFHPHPADFEDITDFSSPSEHQDLMSTALHIPNRTQGLDSAGLCITASHREDNKHTVLTGLTLLVGAC